jgi:ketosteroid isomerase-like protein
MSDSSSAVEARNTALVRHAFAAWHAGTGSPFDLLASDATWTITGRSMAAGTYPSREAFLRDVIRPFNARMREGLRPEVREIIAQDDRVVVLFDARGIARDGLPYTNSYAWFLSLRGEKVVDATAFFDSIAFDALWRRVEPAGG